ncbi:MAG TPA: PfkB family carbohydrate kinase [Ignavibacteria bacterium]|nr:sugar kinase [Ignavibacteria bacterium]HAX50311.1 sugar kinase [Bacteroidota bacterium]HRE11155.1 PfkB family carbohydrate kinase [Ignavibacteria bacterium]HRF64803.1 PfkB family carbohydrate kinase [Ignavibacteria bacterium]HRJ05721.1 PfkB family carbohydrate kinase [Ignavibacteria bacterium]
MSLLVVGSLALDTIETPFGKAERTLGGSATFISVAASYFTQPVRLVGVVGGDFPKKELEYFEEREIDLEGLQIKEDGKTFHWHGKYDYDLNTRESLVTELNVFADFDPIVPETFQKSQYLCLGNIHPALQKKVYLQMQNPKLVVADTMNFWIDGAYDDLVDVLQHINVFIINDSEAREISHEANLFKAAKKIQALGPKIVIIKKGEHGALLFHENELFSAPAYPLESIYDPTGAGDSFAGGFIGYLAKTDDISFENMKRAVIFGSTIASFCVEKFSLEGTRELSHLKIKDRFNEFTRFSTFEPAEL